MPSVIARKSDAIDNNNLLRPKLCFAKLTIQEAGCRQRYRLHFKVSQSGR
jgi:hypothetical protein